MSKSPKSVVFKERTLHGHVTLLPGVNVAFEDPNGISYFIAAGFADPSPLAPTHVYTRAEISIDPNTTFGTGEKRGQRVLEEN